MGGSDYELEFEVVLLVGDGAFGHMVVFVCREYEIWFVGVAGGRREWEIEFQMGLGGAGGCGGGD